MKELPTDDPLCGKGTIRVDGRKIHPAYLVEVKKPAESKYPWDYYKIQATIPASRRSGHSTREGASSSRNRRGAAGAGRGPGAARGAATTRHACAWPCAAGLHPGAARTPSAGRERVAAPLAAP